MAKQSNSQTIADAFKLQGKNISVKNVNIGGTTYEGESRLSTGGILKSRDEIEEEIQYNLIHRFKHIKLPVASWMQGPDLSIEKYTRLELQSESETAGKTEIELHNLFDDVVGEKPRRIRIESQPGFGKTTLAHKIMTDWVKHMTESTSGVMQNNEDYVGQFKFAVLIILRDFNSKTLEDYLAEIIVVEDCEAKDVWRIINIDKTLLILDGLDEVNDAYKNHIHDILFDPTNRYKMTVAACCRCGLFQSTKMQVRAMYKGVQRKRDFWDKKITILGLSDKHRNEFLNNFIAERDRDKILPRLQRTIERREEMFKSPLLLRLLVYVTRENTEIEVKTNTDLYKSLVDYLVTDSINRSNSETSPEEFSVFDSSLKHECKALLHEFGKRAVGCILNEDLHFEQNDLTDKIYNLGFLLKHKTSPDAKIHYECFHLSMVEFAVAFYFLEEFRISEGQFTEEIIKNINGICAKKGAVSLVIPFLCGLLEKDVAHFFDQLYHCRIFYWSNQRLVEHILRECDVDSLDSKRFAEFVPPDFVVSDQLSKSTIEHKCVRENLRDLQIDSPYLWDITSPISLNTVYIELENKPVNRIENIEQIAQNIKCTTLCFYIVDVLSYDDLAMYLELFDKISSEFKNLFVVLKGSENSVHLERCIAEGIFVGKDLDNFSIKLKSKYEMTMVAHMIKSNRIKHVTLFFTYPSDVIFANHPISIAAKSKHTNSILVTSDYFDDDFDLYFDVISNNSEKVWELIRIENVIIHCNSPFAFNERVKTFAINSSNCVSYNFRDEKNALLSLNPAQLRCNYHVLGMLNIDTRASSWGCWDSVTELILVIDESVTQSGAIFREFFKFKQLKIIQIDVICPPNETALIDIIRCLKLVKLDRLEIKWLNECRFDNFIDGLDLEISSVDNVRFTVVINDTLYFEQEEEKRFNLESLLSILKCSSKITVRFTFMWPKDLQNFVAANFLQFLNLNVVYFRTVNNFKNALFMVTRRKNLVVYLDHYVLDVKLRQIS